MTRGRRRLNLVGILPPLSVEKKHNIDIDVCIKAIIDKYID